MGADDRGDGDHADGLDRARMPNFQVTGAYMRRIEDAYTSAPEVRFAVHRSLRNKAGLIVTELLDNEGNVPVDVSDVRGG